MFSLDLSTKICAIFASALIAPLNTWLPEIYIIESHVSIMNVQIYTHTHTHTHTQPSAPPPPSNLLNSGHVENIAHLGRAAKEVIEDTDRPLVDQDRRLQLAPLR